MVRAMAVLMDALMFGVKRAHWSMVKTFGAALDQDCGMTPARFDALYVVFYSGGKRLSTTQQALRRMLGIARSTMSRMLRSLAQLGLVALSEEPRGRTRIVELTARGVAIVKRVMRRFVRSGVVARLLDRAIVRPDSFVQKVADAKRELMGELLWGIRRTFRDRGCVPYHPMVDTYFEDI